MPSYPSCWIVELRVKYCITCSFPTPIEVIICFYLVAVKWKSYFMRRGFARVCLLSLLQVLLVQTSLHAQANLIDDGDFEDPNPCPTSISQLVNVSWTLPIGHTGSSDLFNVCGNAMVGVPSNFQNNNCPAYSGDGYAGGYAGILNNTYREYITDTLLAPLSPNTRYTITFYYRLSQNSDFACDGLGAHFSVQHPAAASSTTGWLEVEPTTRNPVGQFLSDTSSWQLYSQSFIADGGEQYITLGVFDSLPSLQPIDTGFFSNWSYYLYDGIEIFYDPFIGARNHCFGESFQFSVDTNALISALWDFGDPNSGAQNTSTQFFPTHTFTDTGWFDVSVILDYDSITDTLNDQLYVYPRQTLDLGADTLLCSSEELILDVYQDFSTYLWSDGSTADSLLVTDDDTISVIVFGVCDTLQDTIVVRFDDSLQFDLGPDTTICAGTNYLIDGNIQQDAELTWSNGVINSDQITVNSSGVYELRAENGCGVLEDTVVVTVIPIPPAASGLLPEDTVNCFENTIVLEHGGNDSLTYLWSDGSNDRRYEVDSTQTVWLRVSSECGASSDTMNITFVPELRTELGEDTIICDEDSLQLFGADSLASYVWSTGDTTDTIWTTPDRERNYVVTITLGECQRIESKRILLDAVFCPNINCELTYANVFTPNGDGVNDRFIAETDCDVYRFDLAIYNRWGQLVHFSDNIAFGWDGFVNGEPAAAGTYYFVIEYKDLVVVDADRQITRGSFHLMR